MQSKKEKIYRAAAYVRLSKEDGDGELSDSISNQLELIRNFTKNKTDIEIVREFNDDGYIGTDFERPGFQEMMDAVRNGEIDCIIVKDCSRFAREYIGAGKYIERIFPFLGVRFISVNDHFDSFGSREEADTTILPFKNLMNDAYCRDISVKVRSQLDIKRKKGDFISPFAPYGYRKDDRDKNRLVVDEYASDVVQKIFRMKISGWNQKGIADYLNEHGVLSPMEYKKKSGEHFRTGFK